MRIPSTTTALLSALLASVPAIVNAANLTFLIPPHPALLPAGASALPASTHATLHSAGPALSAPLRRDGSFVFVDVAPGSYLLSVHARDHHFEALRVDVEGEGSGEKARAWQTFRGNEWSNKGEKRGEGSGATMTAEVRVVGRKEYYQERGGFSPMSFLKNPMILMGVFSLALIVGMPYLMDNSEFSFLSLLLFSPPSSRILVFLWG